MRRNQTETNMGWLTAAICGRTGANTVRTPGGIPVIANFSDFVTTDGSSDTVGLRLRLEHARLRLLRGFEELLCLQGLNGVEHLPHQIETVRKVLRHFRGRVLLADEVGLGKTIEACLLLREYLLRGLVKRALILVPAPLVAQWSEELRSKFSIEFAIATAPNMNFWAENNLVLSSISLAKSRKHFEAITACAWDLVIVDEAHHCKNRQTRNWQLVNALKRRHLFLLTATPVQNDLVELYNLLTLLEPGHLKTESDFKKHYVRRGNPRDPRNRERLRGLLGEVMIRNTRSLVHINLPPRYAQTFTVTSDAAEAKLYQLLDAYLRWRCVRSAAVADGEAASETTNFDEAQEAGLFSKTEESSTDMDNVIAGDPTLPPLTRMQVNTLLLAAGSHPAALRPMLEDLSGKDSRVLPLLELARAVGRSAKEEKLLELLRKNEKSKTLVFANFRATLTRLQTVLAETGVPFVVFSGAESIAQKAQAVKRFRTDMPVMLCSESGGEGHNLQFCNTLINFDLPWNPMRIEQRIGRVHRFGQTREVFVFNLCTHGSLEARILRLLGDKIRMFELVVGEVSSILGNLEGGEEFESLVLNLWLRSQDGAALDSEFDKLGESLLQAQEEYVKSKELDEALFGDDFE
ncbi:MAG: SNF2-related protein [Planctomycetota bacterium]